MPEHANRYSDQQNIRYKIGYKWYIEMGVWTEKDWNHAPDNCTIPIEGTTGQGGPGCQSLPHDQNL